MGHCVGSAGLLMAVLKGAQGVRSMCCGQYTLFPYASTLNLIKNYLGVGEIMDVAGITTVAPDTAQSVKNVVVDLALRPIPLPAGERCGLSVCRWINAIYGLTHTHSQFNDATHNEIGDIFGIGDLESLRHIGVTMVRHRLVDKEGGDVYLTAPNVANLTMPIHFLAGGLNYIFRPKGTRASLDFLHKMNPAIVAKDFYTATFLPTYAHLDTMIGRNSAERSTPSSSGSWRSTRIGSSEPFDIGHPAAVGCDQRQRGLARPDAKRIAREKPPSEGTSCSLTVHPRRHLLGLLRVTPVPQTESRREPAPGSRRK